MTRNIFNKLLIFTFFIILLIPSVGMIANLKTKNLENRALSKFPKLSKTFPYISSSYFKKIDIYFDEHFYGRDTLIKIYNRFYVNLLQVSPVKKMIVGKDGWFFFTGEDTKNNLRAFRGQQNAEVVATEITKKLEYFEKSILNHKTLLFTIFPPSKMNIYPEFVPEGVPHNTKFNLLNLLNKKLESSKVQNIDLVSVMKNQKKKIQTYYYRDSHWNHFAALELYRLIIENASPNLPGLKHIEKLDTLSFNFNADLSKMVKFDESLQEPITVVKDSRSILKTSVKWPGLNSDITTYFNENGKYKILIIRDSYMVPLLNIIPQSFNYSAFMNIYNITQNCSAVLNYIYEMKPDVVIVEMVERGLPALLAIKNCKSK